MRRVPCRLGAEEGVEVICNTRPSVMILDTPTVCFLITHASYCTCRNASCNRCRIDNYAVGPFSQNPRDYQHVSSTDSPQLRALWIYAHPKYRSRYFFAHFRGDRFCFEHCRLSIFLRLFGHFSLLSPEPRPLPSRGGEATPCATPFAQQFSTLQLLIGLKTNS